MTNAGSRADGPVRRGLWRPAFGIRALQMLVTSLAMVVVACAAPYPDTSYYRLLPPLPSEAAPAGAVMMVEELRVDTAYDDERIAYRTTPYRLEYYEYHRWSAPPGLLVAEYLRSAYASSGHFARVVSDPEPDATVLLSGRVIALEELDRAPGHWVGSIELELELRDVDTREVLWSTRIREREHLDERSPEGLARGTSRALRRVVRRTAPEIARVAHRAGHEAPPRTARDVTDHSNENAR